MKLSQLQLDNLNPKELEALLVANGYLDCKVVNLCPRVNFNKECYAAVYSVLFKDEHSDWDEPCNIYLSYYANGNVRVEW